MPNNVYEDERFTHVENEKNAALSELEQTYGGMVGQVDDFYNAQIDASKQWADKQSQLQQEQTDFAIEQIEQQKEQANKDYIKEQSGAYVDWQKQSNKYGVNAEKMAAQGMTGTGFSESSQVGMYIQYQNRVATARASIEQAVLNYNNAIKDARLQNNAVLAEIAYQALQQQLELSIEGFQYKNSLVIEQTNKKLEVDQMYHNRYQDVLAQINHEKAMAEETRQFNESLAEDVRQFNEQLKYNTTQAELDRQFKAEQAALERQHEIALQNAKTQAEMDLLEKEYALKLAELKEKYGLTEDEKSDSPGGGSALIEKDNTGKYSVAQNGVEAVNINDRDAKGNPLGGNLFGIVADAGTGADAKQFGTFSNGRPKGIRGHGTLSETGDYVTFQTTDLSGAPKTAREAVFVAQDGTLWYWSAAGGKYMPLSVTDSGDNAKTGGQSKTSGGGSAAFAMWESK